MATEQLRLVDGTIVRKCPTDKPLYCSRDGRFYSVHNAELTDEGWVLREIKSSLCKKHRNGGHRGGSVYPHMSNFNHADCHKLIALTWIGPRPVFNTPDGQAIPMEIDHLNGDIMNWSADNLEYVTPAENIRRAKILRVLRRIGREPKQMSREELQAIFNNKTNNNAVSQTAQLTKEEL